mgnify:CR=1 FL=1
MRAKEGAITHFTPQDLMARGACSRLEPQPKLAPATMMSPAWNRRVRGRPEGVGADIIRLRV